MFCVTDTFVGISQVYAGFAAAQQCYCAQPAGNQSGAVLYVTGEPTNCDDASCKS